MRAIRARRGRYRRRRRAGRAVARSGVAATAIGGPLRVDLGLHSQRGAEHRCGASGRSPNRRSPVRGGAATQTESVAPGSSGRRSNQPYASIRSNPASLEQAAPVRRDRPTRAPSSPRTSSVRTVEREAACRPRPRSPAPRCRARARSSGRASRRCRSASGWKTSNASVPPGRAARRSGRSTASRSASSMTGEGSARNGMVTSANRAEVGQRRACRPRSSSRSTACGSARRRASSSIAGEVSTPTTVMPASAVGTATRPDPTPSSSTGPPDAHRQVDVEGDVLDAPTGTRRRSAGPSRS